MVDVAIKTKQFFYFVLWMFIFELIMYGIFLKMKYIISNTRFIIETNTEIDSKPISHYSGIVTIFGNIRPDITLF